MLLVPEVSAEGTIQPWKSILMSSLSHTPPSGTAEMQNSFSEPQIGSGSSTKTSGGGFTVIPMNDSPEHCVRTSVTVTM